MEFLSNMFASVLSYFYSIFHNYGVSVIVVTFLIKVVLSPLNIKQYVINNITEIVEKEVAASVSFGEQGSHGSVQLAPCPLSQRSIKRLRTPIRILYLHIKREKSRSF